MQTQMKMLMKTEWKIKMQIQIEIKTKNTKQNVNDDRKTQMQMQIEIKVAEPPRIPQSSLEEVFEFCWSSFVDEHNSIPKSTRRLTKLDKFIFGTP